jgi:putative ABC transport system permease protein
LLRAGGLVAQFPAAGHGPSIPPLLCGSFAGAVVMLGLTAVTVPARAALWRETLEE